MVVEAYAIDFRNKMHLIEHTSVRRIRYPKEDKNYEKLPIIPLPLAIIENDLSVFTYRFNYGVKARVPICCWYIEGADSRILIDTGADAKVATEFRGFPAEHIASFEEALSRVGPETNDIDLVIHTHLQWDHLR